MMGMLTRVRRTDMNWIVILLAGVCGLVVVAADEASENGCSFHQGFSCHEKATCIDIDKEKNTWECECNGDLEGDGLKGENNTGCGEKECKFSNECFPLANCTSERKCVCFTGYHGDGWTNCTDVDECLGLHPCHVNAYCNNTAGSFKCTCDERNGYFGNGSHCIHTCTMDQDCDKNEECIGQECVCKSGYTKNETNEAEKGCHDINECEEYEPCDSNAICTNTDGGYHCKCKNGYTGNGETCYKMPMNCNDIKIDKPDSKTGKYFIDPDFEGPLEQIEVDCEMRKDFGITIMRPIITNKQRLRTTYYNYSIAYEFTVKEIKAVINTSAFCYQDMKYECRYGATLMNGNDYLVDGNGLKVYAFAGSTIENMCPCGEMTYCRNRSSNCNCDGSDEYGIDEGKELNKERLPYVRFVSQVDSGRADVTIGDVKCAPKPYDFPKDCHDAKFNGYYNAREDSPWYIDVDGLEGPLDPILVHCDVESEKHVGITIIPNSIKDKTVATSTGDVMVQYNVTNDHLNKLVAESDFCQQELSYTCKNSRLMNNGDKKTYFWDINNSEKDYWPSGFGEEKFKCGCALTKMCANKNFGCNCDANDDELRMDFGMVTNKEDLPVGKVTLLDVGGDNQTSQYFVGNLKCSQKQFGIKPLCQDYVNDGSTDSQAYLIDPDGPPTSTGDTDNQDPFLVHCEMTAEPPSSETIVNHDKEEIIVNSNGVWNFTYQNAVKDQITVLLERSYFCSQSVEYKCNNAPIHANGTNVLTWMTRDERILSYIDGEGDTPACRCGLTDPNTCVHNNYDCNCDINDSTQRLDSGLLFNKDDIPMYSVKFNNILTQSSSASLSVGPLICKDLYPNCADLKVFRDTHKLVHENNFENGLYTINPNGQLGVDPFIVECQGTRTIVPVYMEPNSPVTNEDPDDPVSSCYDVKYRTEYNETFYDITPEQIQALVDNSDHCSQELKQTCLNAPLTGFSNYSTCDSQTQLGWSGSQGRDMCACGNLNECKGGAGTACNCDEEDGVESEDGGWIHDKQYLAICGVCVGLDPISTLPSSVTPKRRKVQPTVSDLICDTLRIGKTSSCQDWRNEGMKESGVQMIDPDEGGPVKPTPFYCGISVYPPMGYEIVNPKEPENEIPEEGGVIEIEYWVYSVEIFLTLIESSGYCTQELTLECEDGSLILNGEYGWYSVDNELQSYWAGNEAKTTGCAGEGGQCNCNLPGIQTDGGLIIDKALLPVTQVSFGQSNGTRTLVVGPVKCFNLPKDCEEIRVKHLKRNPLGNNTYTIDPDGAGGVLPFAVECDFETDKTMGITKIKTVIPPGSNNISGSSEPGQTVIELIYEAATYDQVHALAEISGYCFQGFQYTCQKTPLLNFNDPAYGYLTTYGNVNSTTFGVAGSTDVEAGCACFATKSCPGDYGCHCDQQGPMTTVDYGYLTDRDVFPAEEFHLGGQTDPDASAQLDVTDVRCGPRPSGHPKDCQEAFEMKMATGEALIHPNPNVKPFLVSCDMSKGFGITVITSTLEESKEVPFGVPIPVEYYSATHDQLDGLTEVSLFCFMPFRYECMHAKLTDGFHWKGGYNDYARKYIGYGRSYKNECNCGRDGQNGQCGGSEDREYLLTTYRACNCDADDGKSRVDAGVYNSTTKLPIKELLFNENANPLAKGNLTLGKLYCADFDFDLDECSMDFNDCDQHASCTNKHGYYQCRCTQGWQGLGRPDVWANGRDCYDDDECKLQSCPDTSNCTNTNGSFYCVCHDGYEQTAPTTCKDIDECKIGTDNCHENARCINLDGSFACKCNRNYRGNGTYCSPLAECSCFGDPHCLTSDGAIFHYQGECQYTMSRDKCDDLSQTPTYELLIRTAKRPELQITSSVSWVRYATFRIAGHEILLLPNHEVWVNEEEVNLPYQTEQSYHIARHGKYVEIYTSFGVEVIWDGDDYVEIRTPGSFKGQTCGYCGNYNDNPNDDLLLGPACPGTGNQTDNFYVFGNSWLDQSFETDNPVCAVNCTPKENPDCEGVDFVKANSLCNLVWDVNGIFKDCLKVMNETLLEKLKSTCIYDVCAFEDGDASIPLCDTAKVLYQECLNLGIALDNWEEQEFCDNSCEENMTSLSVGPANQVSCLEYLNNTKITETDPPFSEGCFCNEGYYMDGESCVLPEDCGCLYEGKYFKIEDEVTLQDCRSRGQCYSNHTVIFDTIDCDENAECAKKDGRYGCHCKNGYYGDGVNCKNDTCEPNPCGENETCVRDPEKDSGFECLCVMGFMGNCSNCIEIDECATGTDDCPYHAACINTVGSFKCQCLQGFYMLNGECRDINECDSKDRGESLCGNNTKCSNKIGTYHCPCCDGFEKDENGTCVETPGAASNTTCCVCDIEICKEPGKVCGEDQQEYDSIKDMIVSNCEKGLSANKWHQVDYKGKCQANCGEITCPKFQTCENNQGSSQPTCVCDECTLEEKESKVEVCTKKLITYPNYCTFKMVECSFDGEDELHDDMKPCEDKNGVSIVSPWSPWSPCSVSCGKGQQTKYREALKTPLTDTQKAAYPLEESKACYEDPCPGSSCVNYTCDKNAAECVEGSQGQPKCECPDCTNVDIEPVCGYVTNIVGGPRPITWRSECEMLAFVCHNDIQDYELMHEGHCGKIPEKCTRVPDMQFLKGGPNNTYVSDTKYTLNKCVGGCGQEKEDCCRPVKTVERTIPLKMGTKEWNEKFEVIKECECVDIDDLP